MQRRKKCCFRSFLIHGTAADDHLAQSRFIHQRRISRRRCPLRWIELLDVIHEIKTNRFRRPCIELSKDARFAIGINDGRLLEACILRQLCHVIRALWVPPILRCDRDLMDPILQPFYRSIMAFRHFGFDVSQVVLRCVRTRSRCESGECCECSGETGSTVHEKSHRAFTREWQL